MAVLRDLLVDAAAERLILAAPEDRRLGVAVDLATVQAIRDRLHREASLLVLVAVFTGMR